MEGKWAAWRQQLESERLELMDLIDNGNGFTPEHENRLLNIDSMISSMDGNQHFI